MTTKKTLATKKAPAAKQGTTKKVKAAKYLYGEKSWFTYAKELIERGEDKEVILKKLADPYIKTGKAPEYGMKRAKSSYSSAVKLLKKAGK